MRADRVQYGRDYAAAEEDPNAPLRLAVLGPQDDLSTIAGDTLSGSVVTSGAVYSNANLPLTIQTPKKSRRDLKEADLVTPTKSSNKRWSLYSHRDDDDDQTNPETPGTIGVIHTGGQPSEKDGDSTWMSYSSPSRKMYICAFIFGFVLLALIIGLAVAYTVMKDGETENSDASEESSGESYGGFNPEDLANLEPSDTPDLTPAVLAILEKNGVIYSESLLQDVDSPQYKALSWVTADPSFDDYDESRIMQRYALAVFAYGLEVSEDPRKGRALQEILPKWLDYDVNECDWYSTLEDVPTCDGLGHYRHLELEDQGLIGTVPTEFSLLSPSLSKFCAVVAASFVCCKWKPSL
jgi:hypothetical protein